MNIQLQALRDRMDRALSEANRGEGADGEKFMQELIHDLDSRERSRGRVDRVVVVERAER